MFGVMQAEQMRLEIQFPYQSHSLEAEKEADPISTAHYKFPYRKAVQSLEYLLKLCLALYLLDWRGRSRFRAAPIVSLRFPCPVNPEHKQGKLILLIIRLKRIERYCSGGLQSMHENKNYRWQTDYSRCFFLYF